MLWFFLKVDIIIFQNPLQKLRIFAFFFFRGGGGGGGGEGGHFDEKIKNNFKGCGEKMAITRLIFAFDREQSFG